MTTKLLLILLTVIPLVLEAFVMWNKGVCPELEEEGCVPCPPTCATPWITKDCLEECLPSCVCKTGYLRRSPDNTCVPGHCCMPGIPPILHALGIVLSSTPGDCPE
ncbi:venom serine protease inhibitor-like [Hyperolius riggenbachi]|uniref:venom serine protease inhibitor-like n=1 Tax=Hyperolius riggenbachi TaxID=752182 RepID=UPI0035A3A066